MAARRAVAPTMTLQLRLLSSTAEKATDLHKEVLDTTQHWMDTVTSGKEDAPAKTAALYAEDCAFWPTVSTELRVEPQEVRDYFEYFARVPGLKVVPGSYKPFVRTFGSDIATNDGYFTFRADDPSSPNGEKVIPARFTFVYRKNDKTGNWEIVNHHNSVMPSPPPTLKPGYAHTAPKF